MDVMAELEKTWPLLSLGDFSSGSRMLWDLWSRIPDPKTAVPNAYLVIEYGVGFALKDRNLDDAQRWAELAPQFSKIRHDSGEVEFLLGKVAYERGEIESASDWFQVANVKSEGRMFEGEEKKYAQLIR